MNSRAFTLSLVIAGIAVFMAYTYIDGQEKDLKNKFGTDVPVVVAATDIQELDLLDDRKVQIITVPKTFVMPGAFRKIEEIYNTIASTSIKKGEQITKPRVTYPGARSGLARQVAIGKRALSLQIGEGAAVGKLIKPGDRVDVLTLLDYTGGKKDSLKVKTVLQDVLVLSTGLNVTNSIPMVGMKVDKEIKKLNLNAYTNFNTVTVELSPYEVQKMVFIIQTGYPYYLSLRNNDDKAIERISATRLFDVLGEDAAEAKKYFAEQAARKNRGRK